VFEAIAANGTGSRGAAVGGVVVAAGDPSCSVAWSAPCSSCGQFDQLGINARRYAAAAPNARIVTVPRASHLLPLTRPWQTSAIIANFAREVAGTENRWSADSPA
jgi:pimeloyl-ACP methyl ester carboxylesterase